MSYGQGGPFGPGGTDPTTPDGNAGTGSPPPGPPNGPAPWQQGTAPAAPQGQGGPASPGWNAPHPTQPPGHTAPPQGNAAPAQPQWNGTPTAPQGNALPTQPQWTTTPTTPTWNTTPDTGTPDTGTPDWDALADESATRDKRRRWLYIGGGAVATLAVAGIVATAVVTSGGTPNGKPSTLPPEQALPSQSPQPQPSFSEVNVPPPPNPRDYISDPKKDTEPITAAALFPTKSMAVGNRTYPRVAVYGIKDCTAGVQGPLVSLLKRNGCTQLLRATYAKDGVAVTVGIAVMPTKDAAAAVRDNKKTTNLKPLPGGPVQSFCQGTACRMTTNAVGRYAYFTIAGYTNGKAVTTAETQALQFSRDGGSYAFSRILDRGERQAAKAARKQS
ncbi:hypothetical protein [Streptomyces sp. NPDC003077]|uniref:hypothetical protein n=1 Tax=Streptomyces sp. NPDC003077 TaxID=3154443 RepID=UPI0033B1A1B2